MEVTKNNYYSIDANMEYMSVSQFKAFRACESATMAELCGLYQRQITTALLMGSYIDAYFSGELPEFIEANPEVINARNGTLKADFKKCDDLIKRAASDEMFKDFMSGEKQKIFAGELFGIPWKIKVDSLHADKIVDLKVMRDMKPIFKDGERQTFIDAWGYDLQGYIYREIVAQNTGEYLPFYLAVITKEAAPDIEIIHIPDYKLNACAGLVEHYAPRFAAIKRGEIAPEKCGACEWCRWQKKLNRPLEYSELAERL